MAYFGKSAGEARVAKRDRETKKQRWGVGRQPALTAVPSPCGKRTEGWGGVQRGGHRHVRGVRSAFHPFPSCVTDHHLLWKSACGFRIILTTGGSAAERSKLRPRGMWAVMAWKGLPPPPLTLGSHFFPGGLGMGWQAKM